MLLFLKTTYLVFSISITNSTPNSLIPETHQVIQPFLFFLSETFLFCFVFVPILRWVFTVLSRLAFNPWTQVILPPQRPKKQGIQACITAPGSLVMESFAPCNVGGCFSGAVAQPSPGSFFYTHLNNIFCVPCVTILSWATKLFSLCFSPFGGIYFPRDVWERVYRRHIWWEFMCLKMSLFYWPFGW